MERGRDGSGTGYDREGLRTRCGAACTAHDRGGSLHQRVGAEHRFGTTMQSIRIRERAQLLMSFFSLQALAQLLAALSGILVVRTLGIREFAVYTLVTALQATFAVLTDNGISAMVVARAGRVHFDRARLGQLVASARQMRRRLVAGVIVAGAPIIWFWLKGKNLTTSQFVGLGVLIALSLHFQASASIFGSVPLVLLEVNKVQITQLTGAVVRLVALSLVLIAMPGFMPALWANTLGVGVQAWLARRFAAEHINVMAASHEADLKDLKTMVRAQSLNSVYYAFSGQVTVWLIGFFGTTRAVAEVGALGRLSSVVMLGQSALGMLVGPRLARLQTAGPFRRRYVLITSLSLLLAGSLCGLATLAPAAFLWVLGPSYAGLKAELPLVILSSSIYLVSTTVFVLNNSKAWIEAAWIAVPLILAVQAVSLVFLEVGTVRGAILFGLLSSIPPLLVNSTIAVVKIISWERSEKKSALEKG